MAALRPIDLYLQLTSGFQGRSGVLHTFGELKLNTPLKTNMSVENQWLEDVFPIEIVPFRGHVSFRGGVNVTEKADIFFVAIEKKTPRDPGSPCQVMIGVYNHLRKTRYLDSIAILRRWARIFTVTHLLFPSVLQNTQGIFFSYP